jgi:UDP-N-acetylmuramate: L-alanyl-gamma-D-glutamyl-meso-diaminopimelate ligase
MRVYFLGIAGTAMGNTALLLRSFGHEVMGVDENVFPPMSDVLRQAGIIFHEGYDAERLAECAPDLAVVGNVISRGNPEIEWLLDSRRVTYDSLPAVLRRMVLGDRRNIVVAGTHGKTTTTALTAFLLRENGYDPGFLIGGVPLDPPVGTHAGCPEHPFVIEGDEYDSAFFDKRSKFIHYAPQVAVLNNLEFDHADIFRDLEDVNRTFSHFLRLVPRSGFVVANGDDANLRKLLPVPWTSVYLVGEGEANDLRIVSFSETVDGSRFDLIWKKQPWASIAWKQHGIYNARNAAAAALAAALAVSPDHPSALRLDGLASFRGVRRRHEIRFQSPRLTVIEDFGHHPTAIRETLKSLRNQYPNTYLMAAFEPRSNTARTRVFQEALVPALSGADRAVIAPVNRADHLDPSTRLDTASLVSHLSLAGTKADACDTHDETFRLLRCEMDAPRDQPVVVVLFSNGSFGGIIDRLAE